MGPRSKRSPERIGLWSRRKFGQLDQRSAEAHEERRLIRELSEHVGQPSAAQRILIRHCARTLVMLTLIERRLIEGEADFGDLASRQVIALANSARLSLQALGMERPSERPVSLKQYIGGERAA